LDGGGDKDRLVRHCGGKTLHFRARDPTFFAPPPARGLDVLPACAGRSRILGDMPSLFMIRRTDVTRYLMPARLRMSARSLRMILQSLA